MRVADRGLDLAVQMAHKGLGKGDLARLQANAAEAAERLSPGLSSSALEELSTSLTSSAHASGAVTGGGAAPARTAIELLDRAIDNVSAVPESQLVVAARGVARLRAEIGEITSGKADVGESHAMLSQVARGMQQSNDAPRPLDSLTPPEFQLDFRDLRRG